MQYLYNGGCETLQVEQSDVLELMAAANFFQLNGLLRYCEAQCSSMVDLDNIVSMYIHAKVIEVGSLYWTVSRLTVQSFCKDAKTWACNFYESHPIMFVIK